MKAVAYCVGVENSLDRYKLLFLDVDSKELPEQLVTKLNSHPDVPAYLILQTGGGYHVVCFKPLKAEVWLELLDYFSDFIDEQFYAFSVKNNYSVLRISAKISTKDAKTVISPAPSFVKFVELAKYPTNTIQLIYQSLYRFESYFAEFNKKYLKPARIHFYLTASK